MKLLSKEYEFIAYALGPEQAVYSLIHRDACRIEAQVPLALNGGGSPFDPRGS